MFFVGCLGGSESISYAAKTPSEPANKQVERILGGHRKVEPAYRTAANICNKMELHLTKTDPVAVTLVFERAETTLPVTYYFETYPEALTFFESVPVSWWDKLSTRVIAPYHESGAGPILSVEEAMVRVKQLREILKVE